MRSPSRYPRDLTEKVTTGVWFPSQLWLEGLLGSLTRGPVKLPVRKTLHTTLGGHETPLSGCGRGASQVLGP